MLLKKNLLILFYYVWSLEALQFPDGYIFALQTVAFLEWTSCVHGASFKFLMQFGSG